MGAPATTFAPLKEKLDAAVTGDDVDAIAHRVKQVLQEMLKGNAMPLPEAVRIPLRDTYARRLLHRDPEGRYTAVAMTWGPGQGTPLHDHAGIWCVECVVDGEMEVRQYDLVEENAGTFRFQPQPAIEAVRGSAGCLIPPFEYHTLSNRRADGASITLHIYGGEMTHCHVFEPSGNATYRRVEKQLSYHP
jgi:predicted metal-dependent enzyme (double-stranded beta helix superfamily)